VACRAPRSACSRGHHHRRALKPLGYATGQFGKNHLGDRNEFLPTVHGFDEFFGNLYHLNAEEEPEHPDYPKDPRSGKFGPRGVLKCKATDRDDPTVDPRFGKVGKQTIEDTGRSPRSGWRRSTTRPPRRDRLHQAPGQANSRSSAGGTHAHASLHPCAPESKAAAAAANT
jgi:arylsulfatase A-like enzyme